MMRNLFLFISILLFSCDLSAQKKVDFELPIRETRIEGSHYNQFEYLDMRSDKANLGYTSSNFAGKFKIVNQIPLRKQFTALAESTIGSEAGSRTLLMQLRKLSFSEGEKENKGWNVCRFRATFYEQDRDAYYFISTVDTMIVTSQNNIFGDVSDVINTALAQNLRILPLDDETPFTLAEIKDIDALERITLPLFTGASLADGVYLDYKSLFKLTPSITDMRVNMDKKGLKDVVVDDVDKPGKEKKLKAKDVYAIVAEGDLYIAYDNKFCRAFLENGNLKFITVQSLNSKLITDVAFAVGSGGSYGAGIGLNLGPKPKAYVKMAIDQLDGEFLFEDYAE